MVAILMTRFGAGINALAFAENNNAFTNSVRGNTKAECKWDDLVEENLQNGDRMKQLGFINQSLCQKKETKAYINNAEKEMAECYLVFAKQIKTLPPKAWW